MIKVRLLLALQPAVLALAACGNQARPSPPSSPQAGVTWWNDRVFYEVANLTVGDRGAFDGHLPLPSLQPNTSVILALRPSRVS